METMIILYLKKNSQRSNDMIAFNSNYFILSIFDFEGLFYFY
jgi:hypothetical protein